MIAIVAADPLETDLLRKELSPCEVLSCGGRDLFLGNLFGHTCALLHCGIGKASAAAATAVLIEGNRPSAVIMIGCAGAYPESGLKIGDIALANEEIYGDEGVLTPEGFKDMEAIKLPLSKKPGSYLYNRIPVSRNLLEKARPFMEQTALETGCNLSEGAFVTVSTCSGTLTKGKEIKDRTSGICENMEGAAVAQACLLQGTAFLEIRGISNMVEDRNLDNWDLKRGSHIAQKALRNFLTVWHDDRELA